jgi:hypothetical protein
MTTETKAYPVMLKGEMTEIPSRWIWIFKMILAIPHFIILFFLGVAACFVSIAAFFSIVFTGKYPKSLFNYNVGVMRWAWRVGFYSYQALGTDKYPPFSLESDPAYPADLQIQYPEKLSQGLVWIKWWLLAIPHYIVLVFFQGGYGQGKIGLTTVLALFGAIALLFSGRYPAEIFKLVIGMNRWAYRVCAYTALMTDEYPPFRLWDN